LHETLGATDGVHRLSLELRFDGGDGKYQGGIDALYARGRECRMRDEHCGTFTQMESPGDVMRKGLDLGTMTLAGMAHEVSTTWCTDFRSQAKLGLDVFDR